MAYFAKYAEVLAAYFAKYASFGRYPAASRANSRANASDRFANM